jgi:hypothetical protein
LEWSVPYYPRRVHWIAGWLQEMDGLRQAIGTTT